MLLNTEKYEKLSLQKVFQRNKQSVNQTKIIIIIIKKKTKMEVLCAGYNLKKKLKKKKKKIKLIREYTYLYGS